MYIFGNVLLYHDTLIDVSNLLLVVGTILVDQPLEATTKQAMHLCSSGTVNLRHKWRILPVG